MTENRRLQFRFRLAAMRLCCIAGLLFLQPAQVVASAPNIATWLKMADLCEDVIVTQSVDVLEGMQPSDNFSIGMDSVNETSVLSDDSAVTLSAAEISGVFFLCVAQSNSVLRNADTAALKSAWVAAFSLRAAQTQYEPFMFDHPSQIDPAMLRCLGDGEFLVVFAYLGPDIGAFRVGASTSLPSKFGNPCLGGES